jgi:hypothetical protein
VSGVGGGGGGVWGDESAILFSMLSYFISFFSCPVGLM